MPPVLRKMSLLGRPARLRPGLTERTLPGGHRWQSTAVPRLAETSLSRTQAPRALLPNSVPFSTSTVQVQVPATLTLKAGPGEVGRASQPLPQGANETSCTVSGILSQKQCCPSSGGLQTRSHGLQPRPPRSGRGRGRLPRPHRVLWLTQDVRADVTKTPSSVPCRSDASFPDTWPRALLRGWGTGSHPAGAPSSPECGVCAVCTWERTSVCVCTCAHCGHREAWGGSVAGPSARVCPSSHIQPGPGSRILQPGTDTDSHIAATAGGEQSCWPTGEADCPSLSQEGLALSSGCRSRPGET